MAEIKQNIRWKSEVLSLLIDGFGVDDIALKLECKVSDVRDEIGVLRASGLLKKLFGSRT